jgi:hypothetical protein
MVFIMLSVKGPIYTEPVPGKSEYIPHTKRPRQVYPQSHCMILNSHVRRIQLRKAGLGPIMFRFDINLLPTGEVKCLLTGVGLALLVKSPSEVSELKSSHGEFRKLKTSASIKRRRSIPC